MEQIAWNVKDTIRTYAEHVKQASRNTNTTLAMCSMWIAFLNVHLPHITMSN